LHHIPDYDVLYLAFPPNLALLIATGRSDYLTKLARDPVPLQRVRLLLGLGEYMHDSVTEGLHIYFGNPSGTLAPELLTALQETGMSERAHGIAEAIAAFGQNYPIEDRKRADLFAQSFLRIQEGIIPDLSKPPTAVDIKLRELGSKFADKTRFREDVETYARRDPVVAASLIQAREHLSDEQRLSYLQERLLPGVSGFGDAVVIKDGIERMPASYRTVLLLTILRGELFNGGIHQYFSNSSGAFAEYAAQALRDVGMASTAATIDKAISMFPKPYPMSTEERRRVSFEHDWNEWDDRLNGLTNEIDGDDIQGALAVYARQQGILPQ